MRKRSDTFKFRLSAEERRAIVELAKQLKRSQSDAVRFVVVEAATQMTQNDFPPVVLSNENQETNEGGTHGTD